MSDKWRKLNDERWKKKSKQGLRLRLFWLKLIFGNHFPENKTFGCYVKFGQTENVFSLTESSAKNDWNHFQSLFSLQSFSSSLSHARVSHTRTASVKPSLLRPTHRAKRNHPHRRTTIQARRSQAPIHSTSTQFKRSKLRSTPHRKRNKLQSTPSTRRKSLWSTPIRSRSKLRFSRRSRWVFFFRFSLRSAHFSPIHLYFSGPLFFHFWQPYFSDPQIITSVLTSTHCDACSLLLFLLLLYINFLGIWL